MKPYAILGASLLLLAAAPDQEKVSEISLKRTPCFGTCPVDEVKIELLEARNIQLPFNSACPPIN